MDLDCLGRCGWHLNGNLKKKKMHVIIVKMLQFLGKEFGVREEAAAGAIDGGIRTTILIPKKKEK